MRRRGTREGDDVKHDGCFHGDWAHRRLRHQFRSHSVCVLNTLEHEWLNTCTTSQLNRFKYLVFTATDNGTQSWFVEPFFVTLFISCDNLTEWDRKYLIFVLIFCIILYSLTATLILIYIRPDVFHFPLRFHVPSTQNKTSFPLSKILWSETNVIKSKHRVNIKYCWM